MTCSDTGSQNRLDLIQSLVPPHYVCNGYVFSNHKVVFVCFILLQDEPSDFGVPMKVTYVLNQNNSVTEELLSEMVGTIYSLV